MARSGFTGDFAKLDRWIKRLDGAPKVLEIAARNMSDEALVLVADGFRRETDPYGDAWKKLKVRRGKILQDTGRLRASWHRVRVSRSGFRIAAGATYAKFHQDGTRRMVARMMVPRSGRLPKRWRDAMTEAAEEAFEAHFGR